VELCHKAPAHLTGPGCGTWDSEGALGGQLRGRHLGGASTASPNFAASVRGLRPGMLTTTQRPGYAWYGQAMPAVPNTGKASWDAFPRLGRTCGSSIQAQVYFVPFATWWHGRPKGTFGVRLAQAGLCLLMPFIPHTGLPLQKFTKALVRPPSSSAWIASATASRR
jgi:hypothetical protein